MAVKFHLEEVSKDANMNVTVAGYYVDGGTQITPTRTFNFDPTEVSVAGMQDAVSAAQPIPDPAVAEKSAAADAAIAKIDSFVGTDVTLDAPVTDSLEVPAEPEPQP